MNARTVLARRPFRMQFLAHATSILGDHLVSVALAFAVLDIGASASDLGAVLGARTAAMVIFLLVGGVWADRVPREKLMLLSDVGRAATQGVLAILVLGGTAELSHFVVLQTLNGIATAFYHPAQMGLTRRTVGEDLLQEANALLSLTYSVAAIAGPAIAGVIVALAGAGTALAVDAATFVVSALFLFGIKLPAAGTSREKSRFLAELAAGWAEVRSNAWIWISILNFMLFQLVVLAPFTVLGPIVADRSLGGASAWAAVLTASGLGSIAGDFVAMRLRPERPLRTSFLFMLLTVPALLLLGAGGPLWTVVAAAIPWGLSFSVGNVLWFTTLQQNVRDEALSRVSSFDWVGSSVLHPVGFAAAGPLAATFGLGETLVATAVVIAFVEIATALSPPVSAIRRRESIEPAGVR